MLSRFLLIDIESSKSAHTTLNWHTSGAKKFVVVQEGENPAKTAYLNTALIKRDLGDKQTNSNEHERGQTGKHSSAVAMHMPHRACMQHARAAQPRARNAKHAPGATTRGANDALDDRSGGWFMSHVIRRAGFTIAGQHEASQRHAGRVATC